MIPADIKEMAKHDPLVAEILASGGPLFFADFQRLRNGEAQAVARSISRKSRMASTTFLIIVVLYAALLIAGVTLQDVAESRIDDLIRALSLIIYAGMAFFLWRKRASSLDLVRRIDAGEFSAD